MKAIVDRARSLFIRSFNEEPVAVAIAPARVELLGNHTDYNEGVVLSLAIDRYMAVAVGPGPELAYMQCVSDLFDQVRTIEECRPQKGDLAWTNYPLGVMAMLKNDGCSLDPCRVAVAGDIPMGAGLSSSAALEIATGLSLCAMFGQTLDPPHLARLCQQAEHQFAGTHCGLLDQYSVLFGRQDHALYIDFRTLEHESIPLAAPDLNLALCASGVTHSLSESAYNDRHDECSRAATFFSEHNPRVTALRDVRLDDLEKARERLNPVLYARALHIIGENARVAEARTHMREGDMRGLGECLYASHESSRNNFENSCFELDTLVEISRSIDGVYGSRLTGGGFGGATLSLLHTGACARFKETLPRLYHDRTGLQTEPLFAHTSDGARVI